MIHLCNFSYRLSLVPVGSDHGNFSIVLAVSQVLELASV